MQQVQTEDTLCLFQHLFTVFAFPRVLIVHTFSQEMTQHKHKLALHTVYCLLYCTACYLDILMRAEMESHAQGTQGALWSHL